MHKTKTPPVCFISTCSPTPGEKRRGRKKWLFAVLYG
nr:hypothetical protein BSM_35380 [uncultured archaeon]